MRKTRHGKPAAGERRARKRWTEEEARRSVEAFIAEFSAAERDVSAVDDLLAGRR